MRIRRFLVRLIVFTAVPVSLASAPAAVSGQTEGAGRLLGTRSDPIVAQLDPETSTRDLLQRARDFAALGDDAGAEMVYKAILIREPEHVSAMVELALIYENNGKLLYAMGLLTRASLAKPYDAAIIDRHHQIVTKLSLQLRAEVDSLLAQGAYDLAIPKLASLLTTEPENPELYYRKAQCHLQLGRPDVALAEIEKALNLRKAQMYFELQEAAAAAVRDGEIRDLVGRAEVLLPAVTPSGKEEVLGYLARILELDPDHEWARGHFDSLTASGEKKERSRVTSHLAAFGARISGVVRRIGRGALDLLRVLYRHLEFLLMILLVFFILNSPFTHMLVRGFSPRQSLAGQLGQFTIHEVLTLLNTHQSTGALRLKTPAIKGHIYFEDGEVYHCKCKRKTGRKALQQLLENAGEGFFVFTEAAGANQKTIDTPLSLILMELPERTQSVTSKSILQKKKRKSRMKTLLGSKS
ncbi:MAG: DUF4388 domain-containing protein [Candidatus Krumholzibacteriia bacterium]